MNAPIVSTREACAAGFRLLAGVWRRAWPAAAIACGVVGAWVHVLAAGAGSGAALLVTGLAGAAGLLWVTGLCRLAIGRGADKGRWPGDVWRVLASSALQALLAAVLALLLFVVILCLAYAVAAAGRGFSPGDPATWAAAVDARGRWVVGVATLVGTLGLIWVMVRVSLAPIASVAEGRVRVLSGWPLTRGAAVPIAAAFVVVAVVPAAILTVLARLDPPNGVWAGWARDLAAGAIVAGLWLPLEVGVMSYFYRQSDIDSPA
jgi:hypothetical protein